jgi:hypothetical protein
MNTIYDIFILEVFLMDKKNKKHIYLIPANFDDYNLDDLQKENDRTDFGICWSNGYEDGTHAQKFNIGDTVYIYFHDIRRITDRILLKAEVAKSDVTDDKIDNNYLFSDYCKKVVENHDLIATYSEEKQRDLNEWSKKKYHGFYLKRFHAISENDENTFKYIHKDEIISPSVQKTGIMGVHISQTKINLNQSKYNDLKEALNNAKFKRGLITLRDKYNNDACIVCSEAEKGKHSFLKPNNLYYYETHHVLQQSFNNVIIKNKPNWFIDEKYMKNDVNILIYNDYNEVKLCPYHHNLLHYGKYDKRRKVLDKLVDDYYKKELKKIVGNDMDCNEILNYIYSQYGLSYYE